MKKLIGILLVVPVAAMLLTACGGGGGGGGTDTDPVANAGPDKNVATGSRVTLDGSGSSNASTYSWSLTPPAGSSATLSSATVSRPTFTADTAGTYTLSLVVGNGSVNSSPDTATITAVSPRPVPDTGQTKCYDAAGPEIPCSGSGQDADYNDIVSQPSYTDPDNGTITDNVTGLMWQKCTIGQSGSDCAAGSAGASNWYEASGTTDVVSNPSGTNVCGDLTLAGHDDWRLPTDSELMTLADYSGSFAYAINPTYFPHTQPGTYWSSTTLSELFVVTPKAWDIFVSSGSVGSSPKTDLGRVRCVRGEQSPPALTDNGDGTVTDLATGLMWQKQDDGTEKSWTDAMAYCEGRTLGGHDGWRLPNVKELRSIVDTTKWTPAINKTYFPGTQPYPYWSSTTYVGITNQAWTIGFNSGGTGQSTKGTANYVRCVR